MLPKKIIAKNNPFILACSCGDVAKITTLFQKTESSCYAVGLQEFLIFLSKNSPDKKDFPTILSHRAALMLFASRLDLYDWNFIAGEIKKLSKNLPVATILFRHFLKKKSVLYTLDQTKKNGCSRSFVSTRQELTAKNISDFLEERTLLNQLVDYPLLRLFYISKKTGRNKWSVDLGKQHISLKAALPTVNEGNVATASITFLMKISGQRHAYCYQEITLPILIPTKASLEEPTLNFDDLSARSNKPYAKLRILFDQGLHALGVDEKKHGHSPDYEHPDGVRSADSIKHSEQSLALYLYEEKNVLFLIKQLISKLRHDTKSPAMLGDTIKFIAVTLHLHSTKTPCAVCETVLAGLMDREDGGFLQRFKDVLSNENGQSYFRFTTPKSGVRLHTLYSADTFDSDHKQAQHVSVTSVTEQNMQKKSNRVFCSLFRHGLARNYIPFASESEISVLSSGGEASEKTRHTKQTINAKYQKVCNAPLENMGFWHKILNEIEAVESAKAHQFGLKQ